MLLSDRDIKENVKKKRIIVKPAPNFKTQLGPCSLDLRLGCDFRVFEYTSTPYIDIKKGMSAELTRPIRVEKNVPFTVQPGELVLATTEEWIELPDNMAARLEGRSSLGRIGIIVHATAQLIPPGWKGNLVLELSNIARLPVALYPGMRVCALSFEELSSPAAIPYYKNKTSKYINQKGSVASRIDKRDLG
ncbi:dCTP deaminase [Candidatus Roizmanbacteria bacterium RIFCSPHIGHO2_12_FULL_44_10]|uniref:dCTP deaminase n=1 Tax=Candidatus Roizmanbacteria bacterium RIFCSPHIGHO2_12_FULL_44_10 TaxID=1802054 RepID=A0A1F7I7U6_9BACT|nr:MAG: dCTP deaminase [Candidatus Roizmanbacteria bacterium RIFCSPHIGHO2_12_FULL_44_10]